MTSVGDAAGVKYSQPKAIVPRDVYDPETDKMTSPQSLPEPVDHALLELVQSVQHELRTPLHGMLALLSSLTHDMKREIKETGNEQKVQDMEALGSQLLSVLNDFRDYASHTMAARETENVQHEVEPEEEADLGEILDDMAAEVWNDQVKALQAAKGPDVRIPPPPELILTLDTSLRKKKTMVCVDAFRKVARKLIDNALRFTTGEGYVEVSLAPHREEDIDTQDPSTSKSRCYLRLAVEDTGSGMTDSFVSDQLFTPFAKADKFKSGAGLSMSLCSALVRKMKGSMQVSSDVGRGTTVIVLVPVESLAEKSVEDDAKSDSPDELVYFFRFDSIGLKRLAGSIAGQLATAANLYTTTHVAEADCILIPEEACYGEDNDALHKLLDEAKEGVKIGVLQAHRDAKIHLAAKKNNSPPPVYVTRKPFGPRSFSRLVQMATMDMSSIAIGEIDLGRLGEGSEVPGRRKGSLGDKSLYAAPVPSSPKQPDPSGTSKANHTGDLVFSTDMSDEILRGTPPPARLISPLRDKTPVDRPRRSFTALCVEDNPLNMRILTRVMAQCKIAFTMAADGVEAVEQFQKTQPSIVLLDINMPRKDGFEAALEIRQCQQHPTYIIAITALSDEYSRRKGLQECKMDQWLTKPLDIIGFKKSIAELKVKFEAPNQFPF